MKKLMIMVLLGFCCVPFVKAQDEYHKFEVYGGYSRDISSDPNINISGAFNERQAGNGEDASFNGFNASATYNFSKHLGIKVDVADHFSSGTIQAGVITGNAGGTTKKNRFTFQGGIQIKNNSKEARFKPFGHVLAGINRQSVKIENADQNTINVYGSDKISSTGFAATFGGGLDIRVGKRFDIRVIQFNYTVNSVSSKTLAQINPLGIPYTTAIEGGKQNQFTFGFGIAFH
jgi:hypothetical protein